MAFIKYNDAPIVQIVKNAPKIDSSNNLEEDDKNSKKNAKVSKENK